MSGMAGENQLRLRCSPYGTCRLKMTGCRCVGCGAGVSLGGRGRGDSQWCVPAGLGVVGISEWCVSGLVPRAGQGGMVWGWHCWLWGGRGWLLCWTEVRASRRVVWVLRVRVVRVLRSLHLWF